MANVMARLGTKKSWVVHGEDGLDEITLTGRTFVCEICCDNVREFEVSPATFGVDVVDANSLPRVSTSAESANLIRAVLVNERGDDAAEYLVAVNAAAAIYLTSETDSLQGAFVAAIESIRRGSASNKLQALAEATNQ
jgi:anthranilate phosphoribosyltransferase